MDRWRWKWTLTALFIGVVGCTGSASRTATVNIKVQIRFPQGTSIERVDLAASKVTAALRTLPKAERGETVSRAAELEAYVQMTSDHAVDEVRSVLNAADLAGAGDPEISTLAGDMPEVAPQMQPHLTVQVDREKAAALGIAASDIDEAIAHLQSKQPTPEELSSIMLKAGNGQQVPLSAVARLSTEMHPDCTVRKWP